MVAFGWTFFRNHVHKMCGENVILIRNNTETLKGFFGNGRP